jgi:hypothetical protein
MRKRRTPRTGNVARYRNILIYFVPVLVASIFTLTEPPAMTRYSYFERVSNISITDGVVKFELSTARPDAEGENGAMKLEPSLAMATSLPGLLRMHEQMNHVIAQLVERGVLKKKGGLTDPQHTGDLLRPDNSKLS